MDLILRSLQLLVSIGICGFLMLLSVSAYLFRSVTSMYVAGGVSY